jgi:hypothetical protein
MPHRVPKSTNRLAQLVKELNQAIVDNDNERESRLYSELESIVTYIRDKPEVESSTTWRERNRIVAAINRSLEQIRKHDPRLARTLGGALKTRTFFSYSPEPTGPATEAADPESGPIKKIPPHR